MKGFRTLILSAAISLLGFLQQAGAIDLIPEDYRGMAIAAIGFLMAYFRLITNSKPFEGNPN